MNRRNLHHPSLEESPPHITVPVNWQTVDLYQSFTSVVKDSMECMGKAQRGLTLPILAKYFPLGKTSALRNRISSFKQLADESVAEAWERLQEYIAACPHHGMEEWLII